MRPIQYYYQYEIKLHIMEDRDERISTIMKWVMDPVKGRILVEIARMKIASVSQLTDVCRDIPRSTMYRHLAKLEKEGLVDIARTVQKRGTVERYYSLSDDFNFNEMEPDGGTISMMFFQYMVSYFDMVRKLTDREDFSMKDTPISFTTAPIYASDLEMECAFSTIGRAVQKLMENKAGEGRKKYSLGVMAVPSLDH